MGTAAERILVVSPQPFFEDRGTPIAVRRLLEAAHVCGIQADLLSFPIGRDIPLHGQRHFRSGNPLRLRTVPIGLSLRKLVLDLSMVRAVHKRLRSGDYYGIHALEEAAFFCIPMARRLGLPVVYDMQSSMPEQLQRIAPLRWGPAQRGLRACERWLLKQADFVMCSEGLAEQVRATAPDARVREWRYAAPPTVVRDEDKAALRRDLGIAADAKTVVYTGTFEHYQGLHELVATVPAVCHAVPGTVFVLAGASGPGGQAIRKQVALMGLDDHVTVVNRLPSERMAVFQQMADVLVSPRMFGGNAPLKIFDYLAAGRPIVATDVTAHTCVLDSRVAVLVKPQAEALAQGILSVLTDPPRAEALIDASRTQSETICGWKPFVASIQSLYKEVQSHALAQPQHGPVHPRIELPAVPTRPPAGVLRHPRP